MLKARRFGTSLSWSHAMLAVSCAITTGSIASCTVQVTGTVLPAESARVAFQSPCAQNAIECTSSWPTAIVSLNAGEGQVVTPTDSGFLIEAPPNASGVPIQFVGDASTLGTGATVLSFGWTSSATENDPCMLTPGQEFSTTANPLVNMAPGFHYIRLTVENDIIRDVVESETCGVFGTDVPSFDFVELEIEIRN